VDARERVAVASVILGICVIMMGVMLVVMGLIIGYRRGSFEKPFIPMAAVAFAMIVLIVIGNVIR